MPRLRKLENIEKHKHYNDDPPEHTRDIMVEFLRSFEHLEVLKVQKSLARRLMTESLATANPFKFQLKELALEMHDFITYSEQNDDNMLRLMTPVYRNSSPCSKFP